MPEFLIVCRPVAIIKKKSIPFGLNLFPATYHGRAGFLASIIARLAYSSLWHILHGVYAEYVQIGVDNKTLVE